MVAGCGLDFVFIDTEHIALDRAQLSWMCQTYAALGLPPLVRIPSPDPYQACMVLDGGAAGIIAPYVESVAEVQALRGAVKLRPLKGARLAAALTEPETVEPALGQLWQKHNAAKLFIINVESKPALDRLDELLAVPDLDGVLIGPHDLSCSLGLPEEYDHPRFLEACGTIFRKARAAGVGAGIHFWGNLEQQSRWFELGANLLIHSADITLFEKHMKLELSEIKRAVGLVGEPLSQLAIETVV
jgi:4-hydroxy-2-oxoheptanedioate aldolase